VFIIACVAAYWWVVALPVRQREKRHRELIGSIVAGDKVITAGGIYGVVETVHDKKIDLRIADSVVITLDRRAVVRKQPEK
jgi:preprotein translocase subunit YajC